MELAPNSIEELFFFVAKIQPILLLQNDVVEPSFDPPSYELVSLTFSYDNIMVMYPEFGIVKQKIKYRVYLNDQIEMLLNCNSRV